MTRLADVRGAFDKTVYALEMASGLTLFPISRRLADEQFRGWLTGLGRAVPDDSDRSEAPTVDDLRGILVGLGWEFTEERSESAWVAWEQPTDGAWPPFSTLSLFNPNGPSSERDWSFRLGPIEGPVEIARRVARIRGPQVAVHHSTGLPCVITAEITLAEAMSSWAEE